MKKRVYQYNPSKVFLLIGTNDLDLKHSKEDIIKNIDEIVWYIPFRKLRDSIRKLLINYINNSNYIYNELEIRRRENELTTYNKDNYYKKRVFKENVCWVEIGISSFCNRKCWFCPNSIIDRNSCNIEFINNLRIERAKELLINSYYQIGEISAIIGYAQQSSFTYLFKQKVGMSPRDYRKLHKKV